MGKRIAPSPRSGRINFWPLRTCTTPTLWTRIPSFSGSCRSALRAGEAGTHNAGSAVTEIAGHQALHSARAVDEAGCPASPAVPGGTKIQLARRESVLYARFVSVIMESPGPTSGAVQEVADPVGVWRLVVAGDVGAGHPDRVAEEVVLVEGLPSGERGDAGVPGEAEQSDPVRAGQRRRLEVGADVGGGRAGHVGLGGGGHQPGGAQLAQDFREPLVELRVEVARGVERGPVGGQHAVVVDHAVRLGGAAERA